MKIIKEKDVFFYVPKEITWSTKILYFVDTWYVVAQQLEQLFYPMTEQIEEIFLIKID